MREERRDIGVHGGRQAADEKARQSAQARGGVDMETYEVAWLCSIRHESLFSISGDVLAPLYAVWREGRRRERLRRHRRQHIAERYVRECRCRVVFHSSGDGVTRRR